MSSEEDIVSEADEKSGHELDIKSEDSTDAHIDFTSKLKDATGEIWLFRSENNG